MSLSGWRVRLALAAALLFGSEILLWNDPPQRSALDWLVLAVGYLAISAALLDLGVRYRVRELFGLIVLAGIYALLNGLLLNPQTALLDVPRTLITRVLGAHTLVGLLMLLLSLNRFTRRYALAAAVVGLAWGVWVRWLPLLADMVATAAPLSTMLIYGGGGLILLLIGVSNLPHSAAVRLSPVEWGGVLIVGMLLLWRNLSTLDGFSLVLVVLLLAFCGVLLWFQTREKSATLFDDLGGRPVRPLIVSAAAFLGAGLVGYLLPLTAAHEPLTLYVALFTALGVVWLPSVSLVLGVRAYRKLTRQRRL